jgi:hypothetical protein
MRQFCSREIRHSFSETRGGLLQETNQIYMKIWQYCPSLSNVPNVYIWKFIHPFLCHILPLFICILIIWHNTVLIELLRNVMDDSLCLLRSWDSHYCYTNIYTDLLLYCVTIKLNSFSSKYS